MEKYFHEIKSRKQAFHKIDRPSWYSPLKQAFFNDYKLISVLFSVNVLMGYKFDSLTYESLNKTAYVYYFSLEFPLY